MQQLITQLADAAARIGATPLTFAAGLALMLFGLAYSWFGKVSTGIKLAVFGALFCFTIGLLWYAYVPPAPATTPKAVVRGDYVVDLQFEGLSRAQAEELRQKLEAKGWVIFGVDEVANFRATIIKYGASANQNAALALADDLAKTGTRTAPVRYGTDLRIKPTHIELWVGPP